MSTPQMQPRRFIVIGAGGIGGRLAEDLARLLQYKAPGSALVIVDGDAFEPKNAERQIFSERGNKAMVRQRELQPQFPDIFIAGDDRWVVGEVPEVPPDAEDPGATRVVAASELLNDGDVVYAVVDNFACRKVVFDAARELDNIDVFTGGNDDALFGSTYHYVRRDGKDITDHPAERHPEYTDPPDRNPGELSCQERAAIEGGTQLLATNAAVAAVLLARTQKCIVQDEQDTEAEIFMELGVGLMSGYDRRVEIDAVLTEVPSSKEDVHS